VKEHTGIATKANKWQHTRNDDTKYMVVSKIKKRE
jgi:hypothetical protein